MTNVERLTSTEGNSTAAGVGLEYTASELWKGSGRLEWREDNNNTNWLATVGITRKLDRNWTFVGRDYFNWINPSNGSTDTRQNRLQLGFAYRPVDNNKFDALGLYENKSEYTPDKRNATNIVSLRGNYHPSRPWFISGRFATKQVKETLLGTVDDSYRASLIGARVTYDVTNRWSVGGITTLLVGQGGACARAARACCWRTAISWMAKCVRSLRAACAWSPCCLDCAITCSPAKHSQ